MDGEHGYKVKIQTTPFKVHKTIVLLQCSMFSDKMSDNIQIIYRKSADLAFDVQNPRLVEFDSAGYDEERLINLLWSTMAVEELVMSILAQGFFEHEPLYVLKGEGGRYIVLEGNRRLAAIRSILTPSIIKNGKMDKYSSSITEEIKNQLTNRIPTIEIQERKDAWRLIGFKHVNGAAKWGSYAKAKYISEVHNVFGIELDKIAEQIGDTNKTVQKLYQGLMILQQAQKQAEFDMKDIEVERLYFSHLYTAIGYEKFRQYIGIEDNIQSPTPVPQDKIKHLQEVMDWLFGSKKRGVGRKIRSQNPDLRHLVEILDNETSVVALRAGKSLETAYELSIDNADVLRDSFVKTRITLEKAAAKITGYDGEESLLRQAGSIAELADSIYDQMERRRNAILGNKKERLTE